MPATGESIEKSIFHYRFCNIKLSILKKDKRFYVVFQHFKSESLLCKANLRYILYIIFKATPWFQINKTVKRKALDLQINNYNPPESLYALLSTNMFYLLLLEDREWTSTQQRFCNALWLFIFAFQLPNKKYRDMYLSFYS